MFSRLLFLAENIGKFYRSLSQTFLLPSSPHYAAVFKISKDIRIKDFKPQNAGQELQAFASTARLDAETQ